MSKQLRRYSFTLFVSEEEKEEVRIRLTKRMRLKCSRWSLQLERGEESEKLHLQGRVSFKIARRKSEGITTLEEKDITLKPEHDTEASDFYCHKEETRIDGPWTDKDKEVYIPRQIRDIELYQWQKEIIKISEVWDTRHIEIIYDDSGNIGKSTLCTYMGVHRLGKLLPFCNDYKDILRMTYDIGIQRAYIIDMPRAINKEKLYQFYSAIETIKSGYCYDDRYKFQDRYFDCPNIFVFTNKLPDTCMLSVDRWRFWKVEHEELVKKTLDELY